VEFLPDSKDADAADGDRGALKHSPFQKLPRASERLRYLAAIRELEIPENLPYGLDFWSGKKVLNTEWNESETRIVSFRRGQWESELLAAADKIA
jgi:hypothetical protein